MHDESTAVVREVGVGVGTGSGVDGGEGRGRHRSREGARFQSGGLRGGGRERKAGCEGEEGEGEGEEGDEAHCFMVVWFGLVWLVGWLVG